MLYYLQLNCGRIIIYFILDKFVKCSGWDFLWITKHVDWVISLHVCAGESYETN